MAPVSAPRAAVPALRLVADRERFVSMRRLQAALDGLTWAPIQLATRVGARPISPRLPHALVLALALDAREDGTASGDVVPDVGRLAAQVEADPSTVREALDALLHANVLVRGDDRASRAPDVPPVRIAAELVGTAPRAALLDWRWIATATVGAPSAWVAAHAVAEWMESDDSWVSIPRALLQPLVGAGLAGVRNALDGLIAAAVLERREVAGRASHYRFTSRARGVAGESASGTVDSVPRRVAASTVRPPAGEPAPHAAPAATASPPATAHGGATPVEVTIGGATFDVAPGTRIALNAPGMVVAFDVGVDGKTRVTVGRPTDA